MNLKSMTFTSDEEGAATPATVSVEMSIEEALWVASVASKQRGASPHNGIYSCLVGNVFNCYWEDGLEGAKKEFPVEIPPVKYDN